MKKVLLILTIIYMIFSIFYCGVAMAVDTSDFISGIDDAQNAKYTGSALTSTQSVLATAIMTVRNVALGIAVIMILVLAIKYMTAAPEGKASFKKSAMIYVVGAVLLFGTSGILTLVENFSKTL